MLVLYSKCPVDNTNWNEWYHSQYVIDYLYLDLNFSPKICMYLVNHSQKRHNTVVEYECFVPYFAVESMIWMCFVFCVQLYMEALHILSSWPMSVTEAEQNFSNQNLGDIWLTFLLKRNRWRNLRIVNRIHNFEQP